MTIIATTMWMARRFGCCNESEIRRHPGTGTRRATDTINPHENRPMPAIYARPRALETPAPPGPRHEAPTLLERCPEGVAAQRAEAQPVALSPRLEPALVSVSALGSVSEKWSASHLSMRRSTVTGCSTGAAWLALRSK